MFLLAFQRWLREHTDVEVATAFQRGGELLEQFADLGEVFDLQGDTPVPEPVLDASPYDLVYLNASWTIRSWSALAEPRAVVAHVHEMEDVLRFLLTDADRLALATAPDRILVGCQAAARNLVEHHGVDPARITNVPYSASPRPLASPVAVARAQARERFGLPAAGPVLVGAGVYDWRKAPDLLLQVAWHLHRLGVPCGVLWIGDDIGRPSWCDWDEEAARLGLADVAHRTPATPELTAALVAGDVFVLSSREDTFPLVCLEAASIGLPTVCFDDAGVVELVAEGDDGAAGAAVAYPDLSAMARAIAELVGDPARLAAAGGTARQRFDARHRPEVAHPALLAALAPWLGS